ncbi:sigma-70 family RNA polymerase sigma factor [Planctomycetota bacterium]|nr:sigma-70 family RNA polymerase sigma factor [Planctomycetota bacterium]
MVATLVRRVGVRELEAVEDAAQSALLKALETWRSEGLPEQPSAWVFRVAHNALMGELRTRDRRRRLLAEALPPPAPGQVEAQFPNEVQDDLLRMLFVCCDEAIPIESQLALALKTLCGFSVSEIAQRLFSSEASVYKRLARARERLRSQAETLGALRLDQCAARLPRVHGVLYLLFTEGYLSSHPEASIRRELTDEAVRLGELLAEHPLGRTPETFALLALIHLHAARLSARQNATGGLLLLEEQDRSLWDATRIGTGLAWLARSAEGEAFSRYHAEAGIAAEHCLAPSFAETRWERVVSCYALLEHMAPSALHRLNRAVAVAECRGPHEGLAVLEGFVPPTWLAGSFSWAAVLADLHRRCGNGGAAERYRKLALETAPTPALRALIERRLDG